MTWENQYLDLVAAILETGDDRVDRTGVGTRALFAKTLDIDLTQGFPAMTTKKLAWNAVVAELLWFLEGSSDERRLAEIQFGTRDKSKTTIWTANAQADYWKPKAEFDGDLGRIYGVQWRDWRVYEPVRLPNTNNPDGYAAERESIDQVAELILKLKANPTDRRMIISAWNVADITRMALPPCHMFAQFFVRKGALSCQMYQRSVDTMLGLPFNIASYALLTHMLAHVCNLGVDRLVLNLGDVHIYKNHLEGAKTQLEREPLAPPTLVLDEDVEDIDAFTMAHINLKDYNSLPAIKMEMAV